MNRRSVATGLIGWLIATDVLVWLAHVTGWWPCKVALLLCLLFLPGVALLRALGVRLRTLSTGVVYSFGLSILVLMLSGLLANQALPLFGVLRPLELAGALGSWNVVTAALIIASICFSRQAGAVGQWRPVELSWPAWGLLGMSVVLPCLAMMGAVSLNNGGDAVWAILTLGLAAALIVYAFLLRGRLSDGMLAWLIFVISLSVLLMTSLRGWDIVGHDIEREFRVYTLTHLHARWDIGLDQNPYNACLSITILPEMFARILDVSGLVVFKIILQVVCAICPVVLYVLLRQYVPKLGALVGSMMFISYPTFINDSAMLTRQSVAYLFFALALLVVSNKTQRNRYKFLFLLCATGVTLSHYSTAYMFVALFGVAVICKLGIIRWLTSLQRKPRHFNLRHTVVTPLCAVWLFVIAFIWYSQITGTSSGLVVTLQKSLSNVPELFSNDNKSSDTATALLFAGGKTQVDLYQSYLDTSRTKEPTSAVHNPRYTLELTDDDVPLTPLGQIARSAGLDPSLVTTLRHSFAKVLQLLAVVGVLYAVYRLLRGKPSSLSSDFTCLSLASIILLALIVLLPVLSMNYGVLRAFQQALLILTLPIVLLLAAMSGWLGRRLMTAIATLGTVMVFLLFTGLFAQLLGGSSPSLSMNNRGLYYGLYYSTQADAAAFQWLKAQVAAKSDVRAAHFNKAFMHDPTYPFSKAGILPPQLGTHSYVYLDPAQVGRQRVYAHYENSPLVIAFPLEYYEATKNSIYSTSSTRIYR